MNWGRWLLKKGEEEKKCRFGGSDDSSLLTIEEERAKGRQAKYGLTDEGSVRVPAAIGSRGSTW